MVAIEADWNQAFSVRPAATSKPISEYLANAQQNLQGYRLPLGAELNPVDPDAGAWELVVPQLQFFDVFIKPTAQVRMTIDSARDTLLVTSEDVLIEGSKEVQSLGLEERFDIDVKVVVKQESEKSFAVSTSLQLYVDMPFPFNFTPRPVVETTGSAVFNALLAQMMPAFAEIMVADIEGRYQK